MIGFFTRLFAQETQILLKSTNRNKIHRWPWSRTKILRIIKTYNIFKQIKRNNLQRCWLWTRLWRWRSSCRRCLSAKRDSQMKNKHTHRDRYNISYWWHNARHIRRNQLKISFLNEVLLKKKRFQKKTNLSFRCNRATNGFSFAQTSTNHTRPITP